VPDGPSLGIEISPLPPDTPEYHERVREALADRARFQFQCRLSRALAPPPTTGTVDARWMPLARLGDWAISLPEGGGVLRGQGFWTVTLPGVMPQVLPDEAWGPWCRALRSRRADDLFHESRQDWLTLVQTGMRVTLLPEAGMGFVAVQGGFSSLHTLGKVADLPTILVGLLTPYLDDEFYDYAGMV
jgi:hypothetical protein